MTIFTKATRLIEALTELPSAAMACVEMAREAEANRVSIRAAEAFESVCPDGPALYHANSQIEELTKKLTESERKLAVLRRHSSDMANRVNELESSLAADDKMIRDSRAANEYLTEKLAREAAKLATVEAELNREREARRKRQVKHGEGELPPPNVPVLYQWNPDAGAVSPGVGCMGATGTYWWRYLSPEDMP